MSNENNVVNLNRIKNLTRDDVIDHLERCQMAAEVTLPVANMEALLTQLLGYMDNSKPELQQKLTESERYGRQADITIENLERKVEQLAAENAGLKAAFDKPQAYLSWHAIPPTWEDPLPCGEYLDVHEEAGHKNSDGTDCWPVYAKPEIETPATDAVLAEVRAQGIDECVRQLVISDDDVFSDAPNICAMVAYQLRKGVQS